MSIGGLDLNLVHRAGRPGLTVVVAADTVCAGHAGREDAPRLVRPVPNIDSTEGYPPRPPGAAGRSGYGWSRCDGPVGARIDLSC